MCRQSRFMIVHDLNLLTAPVFLARFEDAFVRHVAQPQATDSEVVAVGEGVVALSERHRCSQRCRTVLYLPRTASPSCGRGLKPTVIPFIEVSDSDRQRRDRQRFRWSLLDRSIYCHGENLHQPPADRQSNTVRSRESGHRVPCHTSNSRAPKAVPDSNWEHLANAGERRGTWAEGLPVIVDNPGF